MGFSARLLSNPKFYRKYEQKLAIAQRAKNKKRVRALHAKIANCRKDHLHKASTMLVKENALIVVGDLSAKKLVKLKWQSLYWIQVFPH